MLNEGDPVVSELAQAMANASPLHGDCQRAVRLYGKLTNPLAHQTIGDLVEVDISSAEQLDRLRQSKGIRTPEVALFPASTSRESELFTRLFPQGIRVIFSPATLHPDESWVAAQGEVFVKQARESGLRVRFVQHDRDSKFSGCFDRFLAKMRTKIVRTPRCAPDC